MDRFDDSNITFAMTPSFPSGNSTGADLGLVPEGCIVKRVSDIIPWENKDNLISKRTEEIFGVILMGVCLPLCFLIAVCTNLVNMVVFWKQGLKERINMCLFSLALSDFIYVPAVYIRYMDVPYAFITGTMSETRPMTLFVTRYQLTGLLGVGKASLFLSTVIALERCVCITRPLLAKNLMSTGKTAVLLWFVNLGLIAISVVSALRFSLLCVFDPSTNRTFFQFFPSSFYRQHKTMIYILSGVISGIALPGVCSSCVIVATVIMVHKMKTLSLWREKVSSASESLTSRDLAVTRMIIGTSILFILCIVPNVLVRFLLFVVPGMNLGGRYENLYIVIIRIYWLVSVVNSTFNFFVYYVYGSKFRQTVHELFASCSWGSKTGKGQKAVKREKVGD